MIDGLKRAIAIVEAELFLLEQRERRGHVSYQSHERSICLQKLNQLFKEELAEAEELQRLANNVDQL